MRFDSYTPQDVADRIAFALAMKWEPDLKQWIEDALLEGRFADALLIAAELDDREENGLRGEWASRPERRADEHLERRTLMILRQLGMKPAPDPWAGIFDRRRERDAETGDDHTTSGEDRRETGGSGAGTLADRRLARLTGGTTEGESERKGEER